MLKTDEIKIVVNIELPGIGVLNINMKPQGITLEGKGVSKELTPEIIRVSQILINAGMGLVKRSLDEHKTDAAKTDQVIGTLQ